MSEAAELNTPVTNTMTDDKGKASVETTSAFTFDELEELTLKSKAKPKSKEKTIDLTSDSDKGKNADSKDKPEKIAADKEDKSDKEAEKTDAPPRKTVKAKVKDQEIEIDEEALIPVNVNGKTEMWTLKELRADKSGKTAWDKKFSEVDKKDKEVMSKLKKAEEINNLIKEIYAETDEDMRLFKIAKLSGEDPVQFRKKFMQDNIKTLENYYNMTDDERKAYDLQFEAKIHKLRADTLEGSIKEQETARSLKAKVDQIRASHNIEEEEFFNQYDKLTLEAQNGYLNPELITPEFIAQTVVADRIYEPALATVESLKLNLDPQQKNQMLVEFVKNAVQLGINPQDVPQIITELYGNKAKSRIEQKQKENSEFIGGKKEVQYQKPQSGEPLLFDEL